MSTDVGAADRSDAEQIYCNLKRLITEGGRENFLIVSVGDVYVQFTCGYGVKSMVCEAVSNKYLPEELQLGERQVSELRRLGFHQRALRRTGVLSPPDHLISPNYHRLFDVSRDEFVQRLAKITLYILKKVYGCSPGSTIQFKINLE